MPVVLYPVGAGATRFRTETATRILDEVDVDVLRANPGKVGALVDVATEMLGVESIGAEKAPREAPRNRARSTSIVMTHWARSTGIRSTRGEVRVRVHAIVEGIHGAPHDFGRCNSRATKGDDTD